MHDASPEMMSLFCAALERPSADERAAYLDAACGQDAALRARLEALGISPRSADFLWAFARAWLLRKIEGEGPDVAPGGGR
jgi:hypothetical protein